MLCLLLCTLVCAVCTFLKIFGGIPRTGDCRKIFPRADNDLNKIQASSIFFPHFVLISFGFCVAPRTRRAGYNVVAHRIISIAIPAVI